jgi:hypothetical protein
MRRASTTLGFVVLAMAGCGSSDYANDPRPPAPINVSAAITNHRVNVSPRSFGAGPITIIIANESDRAQRVTIQSNELGASRPGLKQSTGPINPDGTATLKVDVTEGDYQLSASGSGVKPASVHVGRSRPSAQNQLLQP